MPIHSNKVDAAVAKRRVMRRRRLALALWALAVTPGTGLADELSKGSLTRNPFCDEPSDIVDEPSGVRLAGQNATVGQIRLQPIGQAVGLRDAGHAGLPQAVRSKVFVQNGVASPVRSNPMVESSRPPMLADAAEMEPAPVELTGTILDAGLEESVTPAVPADHDEGGVVLSFGDSAVHATSTQSKDVPENFHPLPVESNGSGHGDGMESLPADNTALETNTTSNDPSLDTAESVFSAGETASDTWSLADDGMFDPRGNAAAAVDIPDASNEIDEIEPVLIRDPAPSHVMLELVETPEDASPLAREVADDINRLLRKHRHRMPVEVESMPIPQSFSDAAAPLGGIDIAEDFTAALDFGSEPAVDDAVSSNGESRDFAKWSGGSSNAVVEPAESAEPHESAALDAPVISDALSTMPPAVLGLDASDQGVVFELVVAPEGQPAPPKRLRLPEGMKLIPLKMNFAQVRSLTVGGKLKQVRVLDESVCQAVTAGDNQVKLIGTGNGVTQLVVWAEMGDGATDKIQAFEVLVDSHEEAGTADESLDTLDQSIARAYPDCRVLLDHRGDHLVVRGQCPSERSAKSILRMVRRTCLIPVHDELKVR